MSCFSRLSLGVFGLGVGAALLLASLERSAPPILPAAQREPGVREAAAASDRWLRPAEEVGEGSARNYVQRDVPRFQVPLRKEELDMYPCSDCHEDEQPDPHERLLEDEHDDLDFDHGDGRLWCYSCHNIEAPDMLKARKGGSIDLDHAYLLCGECHFEQERDWYFGAHGKRIGLWRGPRQIYSCPECHDPHSPSIKPFVPSPPPLARKGLTRGGRPLIPHRKLWEPHTGERR